MWQREMPEREGIYYVRALNGDNAGFLTVCRRLEGGFFNPEHARRNNKSGGFKKGSSWGGWWWSEPIPPHPPFDKESE